MQPGIQNAYRFMMRHGGKAQAIASDIVLSLTYRC
jgi:hypothetical protein